MTRPQRVLLVESDRPERERLRRVLVDAGHDVLTAEDGREGLSCAIDMNPAPAVILIARALPIIDGGELFRILRGYSRFARIPVVLLGAVPTREPVGDVQLCAPVAGEDLLHAVALLANARGSGTG